MKKPYFFLVVVDFGGKKFNIVTFITFPFNFPEVPPILKIKNIDRIIKIDKSDKKKTFLKI